MKKQFQVSMGYYTVYSAWITASSGEEALKIAEDEGADWEHSGDDIETLYQIEDEREIEDEDE